MWHGSEHNNIIVQDGAHTWKSATTVSGIRNNLNESLQGKKNYINKSKIKVLLWCHRHTNLQAQNLHLVI